MVQPARGLGAARARPRGGRHVRWRAHWWRETRRGGAWWREEQQGSQGNLPGKISGGVAHREASVPVGGGEALGQRRSSGDGGSVGRWMMLGSLQHQDDEGEVRGGPIEGEGRRERRLPEERTHDDGGFETAASMTPWWERGWTSGLKAS
jgi:hypothetical protein